MYVCMYLFQEDHGIHVQLLLHQNNACAVANKSEKHRVCVCRHAMHACMSVYVCMYVCMYVKQQISQKNIVYVSVDMRMTIHVCMYVCM